MKEPNNSFLEALYQSTYQKLYRLAYRLVKSPEAADDLVHDTFCLAVFHQAKLRQHPNTEDWIVKIKKNHRLAAIGFMHLDSGKSGIQILESLSLQKYCRYIPDYQPEKLSELSYSK